MREVRPAFVAVSAAVAAALALLVVAGAASPATAPPVYQVHAIGLPPGVTGSGALPVAFDDGGQVVETGFPTSRLSAMGGTT